MQVGKPIRLGLVGIGKIARDQHIPALRADPAFEIVATASRDGEIDGVPAHRNISELLAGGHRLDAVSLCTPAAGRYVVAKAAIAAGLGVMVEKPPAATLSEAEDLGRLAVAQGVTLFTSWHSREAAGVDRARDLLKQYRIKSVHISWKEDIRRWHPGQDWILDEGGFGVFDPGINALAILTRLMPDRVLVDFASIVVPQGRRSPVAATLGMHAGGTAIAAEFDFLQTGPQMWAIDVETDNGALRLSDGGATLQSGNGPPSTAPNDEYPRLYRRFAEMVANGTSDVDLTPLRLVQDALLIARRIEGPIFNW